MSFSKPSSSSNNRNRKRLLDDSVCNIFVMGQTGSGKTSYLNNILKATAEWAASSLPNPNGFILPEKRGSTHRDTIFHATLKYGTFAIYIDARTPQQVADMILELKDEDLKQELVKLLCLNIKTGIALRPDICDYIMANQTRVIRPTGSMDDQRMAIRDHLRPLLLNPEIIMQEVLKTTMVALKYLMFKSITVTLPCAILRHVCLTESPSILPMVYYTNYTVEEKLMAEAGKEARDRADLVMAVLTDPHCMVDRCGYASMLHAVAKNKHQQLLFVWNIHRSIQQEIVELQESNNAFEAKKWMSLIKNNISKSSDLVHKTMKSALECFKNDISPEKAQERIGCCGFVSPTLYEVTDATNAPKRLTDDFVSFIGRLVDPSGNDGNEDSWLEQGKELCVNLIKRK